MCRSQVPGLGTSPEDGAVVTLGVDHEPRVLLGEEAGVVDSSGVGARRLRGEALKLEKLRDDVVLARLRPP
jgi:hypothetical protein